MRHLVMTTAMALIGGLFTAGLVMGGGETKANISAQPEEGQLQPLTTSLQLNEKQVREVQTALNEKGFAVGVDGMVSPKTMDAIRNFQSKEGLTATGQLDQQTLKALGIEIGQQEFMGVSPEFGDEKQPYQPKQMPMKSMERTDQMPMQEMEKQPQGPDAKDY